VVIVDTNVISETMQEIPSPHVLEWWSQQQDEIFVTAITVAEVLYGIANRPPGKRRKALAAGAERMFASVFAGRILSFDEEAARAFAEIAAVRRTQGRPIAQSDAQIAAITRCHHAVLATRNTPDFEGCGLQLVNPWEKEPL
jgi:toxin FitB